MKQSSSRLDAASSLERFRPAAERGGEGDEVELGQADALGDRKPPLEKGSMLLKED